MQLSINNFLNGADWWSSGRKFNYKHQTHMKFALMKKGYRYIQP